MSVSKTFQLTLDRQGWAVFPVGIDLKYDPADKVYYDPDCKYRGEDSFYSVIFDMIPPPPRTSLPHQRRVIHITLEETVDVQPTDDKEIT